MPGSYSHIFSDAEDYQAYLPATMDLLVTQHGEFHAQLTSVELPHISLLHARETLPRVAYVTLPSDLVFITFPTKRLSRLTWDGNEVRFGDILFHSRGERFHELMTDAGSWGLLSLTPANLMAYGKALTAQELVAPIAGKILRPDPKDWMRLSRLHAHAGRIAETNLRHIGHREVARALEQDLIWALVTCLTSAEPRDNLAVTRCHAQTMLRFEEALAANPCQSLRTREICIATLVCERTLRVCCEEILGMSPGRYQRLRRFKRVRAALRRANPATTSVIDVAKRHGFAAYDRFITEYRNVFGETPSLRLRGDGFREN